VNSSPIAIRGCALLADHPQPLGVLGGEQVLQEEQLELLEVLGQLDGLDRGKPGVHVVQELDVLAELLTQLGEHLRHHARVEQRFPRVRRDRVPADRRRPRGLRRAVRRRTGDRHLHADVTVALAQVCADVVLQLLDVTAARVRVDRHRGTGPAAEQLPDGHPGLLALDVPQGFVDAADRVVEHRPAAPV